MLHILALLALAPQTNDKTQANSHDDAWESAWVTHCRTVLSGGSGKTAGFVLQLGDSITHSNPYSQWPRNPNGASAEDTAILNWCQAAVGFPISNNNNPAIKGGFYLAIADTEANADGYRGMTASSGLRADEFLSGANNGTTAMPAQIVTATAQTTVSAGNTTYGGNLNATTVSYAFADAQFAVLMLGTNDASAGRSVTDFMNDMTAIVNLFEAQHIVVILSTIPPHPSAGALATSYNASIRSFAQTNGLPLIDFEEEILARRPGTTWNGTLIVGGANNDVHPTASGGGYDSASSPYGDSATHTTGDACLNVGYLLRSWLTVQKLKEVKSYVVDGVNPGPTPTPTPTPPPVPAGPDLNDGENGDDSINDTLCGGSIGGGGAGWPGLLALAALAISAGTRRSSRAAKRPAR